MIAIVDYGMGNTASVQSALALLGHESIITARAEDFERASHIILPGVGAFGDGMESIVSRGLRDMLAAEVIEKKKPLLGICLGMQLLMTRGEEGGPHDGLGFVDGVVRRLESRGLRLPHIGWNTLEHMRGPLFAGVSSPDFYFVHSYVAAPADGAVVAATCTYGEPFAAALQQGNLFGVQFHPEKSQKSGLRLLQNFINWHA